MSAAKLIGANLVIGRLWGASGFLMPVNNSYALSDFIVQAVTNKKIHINSAHKVYRRYIDAEIFMATLLESAISGKNEKIDSGGPIIEIGDLAKIVAEKLKVGNISRPALLETEIDDYYPRGDQFATIATEFNLPIGDIREQVANTIAGHLRLM
jgi:nucleoside-diphosphate-sugar epimerase